MRYALLSVSATLHDLKNKYNLAKRIDGDQVRMNEVFTSPGTIFITPAHLPIEVYLLQ